MYVCMCTYVYILEGCELMSRDIHINKLYDLLHDMEFSVYLYANDCQFYIIFKVLTAYNTSISIAMANLEACISEMRGYLATNMLLCNDVKPEVLFLILDIRNQWIFF